MAFTINPGRIIQTSIVATDIRDISGLAECIQSFLDRHLQGDWGDLDPDDAAANDHAAICGGRVFSSYRLYPDLAASTGESKVWIITESDRSVTTILWPSEY